MTFISIRGPNKDTIAVKPEAAHLINNILATGDKK